MAEVVLNSAVAITRASSSAMGNIGSAAIRPRRFSMPSSAAPNNNPLVSASSLKRSNDAILHLRRHRCYSCTAAPPRFCQAQTKNNGLRPSNGMFGNHNGGRSMIRACRQQPTAMTSSSSTFCRQQLQRMQFSTKPQQKRPSAQTVRTINIGGNLNNTSSSNAFHNATPTRTSHPLINLFLQSLQHTLLKPRSLTLLPRYISPQHYSFTLSELFGHSSFILVAASYATQDFLELRILAVVGSTSMLFFTYFHPHGRVLWLPLKWNMLFIAINSYRIGKVFYDRYMAEGLSVELKEFREEHLGVVDKVDYYKLVNIAKEEVFEEGDLVLHQGRDNPYIRIVLEGELEVLRDGTLTYVLEKGNFVSEAGLHAGLMLRGSIESCGTIVVGPPFDPTGENNVKTNKKNRVRCLRWNRSELMNLLEDDIALHNALKAAISWDIVRKLKMQRHMLTEGRVKNPTAWTRKREDQGISRYAAILQNMLLHPEDFANMSEVLTKYRRIHRIDDESHQRALAKCGWTEEEFKLGKKRQILEDYEDIEEEEFESARWRRVKRYGSKMVRSLLQ